MIIISFSGYVLRRFFYIIPTLLGISVLSFSIIAISPGDPIQISIGLFYGSQQDYESLYNQRGYELGILKGPENNYSKVNIIVRYCRWLGLMKRPIQNELNPDGSCVVRRSGVLQGDFGRSWLYTHYNGFEGALIADLILSRLWYTLFLTTPAFVISIIVSVIIGVIQATRQYTIWDKGITFASLIGYATPTFWLAKLVVFTAYYGFKFNAIIEADAFIEPFILNWKFYLYLILPTFTMVISGLVFLSRLVRSQMLEVLREKFIIVARSKGLAERTVIYKHAFRVAMLPIITVVGMGLPGLLGGSVMVETVFGWPGLGKIFVDGSLNRDHPLMMASNFIFSALFLFFRVLVDMSYALIDPRIRY